MAENICPFCGKPNPEAAEFCQSCKAHLAPANPSSYEDGSSTQDVSEWLKKTSPDVLGSAPQKPQEKPTSKIQEEAPDWLEKIRERSRLEKETSQESDGIIPESHTEQAIPDWLQDIKEGSEKAPAAGEKDLLSELQSQSEETKPTLIETSESTAPTAPQPLEAEADDLLAKVTALPPLEKKGKRKEEASGVHKLIEKVEDQQPPEPKKENKPVSSDESVPVQPANFKKPFHTGDLQELGSLSMTPEEDAKNSQPAPTEGNAPKLPDWLKELETSVPPEPVTPPKAETSPEIAATAPAVEKFSAPVSKEESQPFTGGELPEWLAKLAPPNTFAGEQLSNPAFTAEKNEPQKESKPVESPFPKTEVPEWIKEGAKKEVAPKTPPKEETPEIPNLEPAQLPPWMQAMRPIESIVPDQLKTVKAFEEDTGPLAGISDALPGLGAVGAYQKPPVLTGKLSVNERQRNHAHVLESLLEGKQDTTETSQAAEKKSGRIFRVVVSLLMVAIIFWLMQSGLQIAPRPDYSLNGVTSTYNFVNNLPNDSLILLVMDFEPALEGEMKQASMALLEQLMIKDTRLAIISTNSTGPILAQDLLSEAQMKHTAYAISENVINLGWLAGGATGLQNFSRLPSLEVTSTWQQGVIGDASPILRNALNLQIFHAVIILTDNADTGRLWVEQVQPTIAGLPTFMVTSALAGPILQPFLDSHQVQGMISGIEGGLIYSIQAQLPGNALASWSAFQVGLVLSVAVMFIGGIIQLARRSPRKQKPPVEGKE